MLSFKRNPEFDLPAEAQTPAWAFFRRRDLLRAGAAGVLGWWGKSAWAASQLKFKGNSDFKGIESPRALTKRDLALSYNNFYEFSLEKSDVKDLSKNWAIKNWQLEVTGLVERPRKLDLAALTGEFPLEERNYRFRCVEAWSMVLPWVGFPLGALLDSVKPKSDAKYVKFVSCGDDRVMPNIKKQPEYPWPYTEGLRLDEAKNPLSFLAVGLYGEGLAPQNGAPVRLVVPWKYGFKNIKSLVRIELVKDQPVGLWEERAPKEYGFYANVNPKVDHPRWSQASERVVDGSLFPKRIPTLMFNGYEKYVAALYAGLDLRKNY